MECSVHKTELLTEIYTMYIVMRMRQYTYIKNIESKKINKAKKKSYLNQYPHRYFVLKRLLNKKTWKIIKDGFNQTINEKQENERENSLLKKELISLKEENKKLQMVNKRLKAKIKKLAG